MGFSRRELLAAGGAGLLLPGWAGRLWGQAQASTSIVTPENAVSGFRFVHMTDWHIQPEKGGVEGVVKALHRVQELDIKPDFILTGGDLVFDSFKASRDRSLQLFDLFNKTIKDECTLKVYPCIGNHDVYAWGDPTRANDPLFGKMMAKEKFELDKTYYAFNHKGIRFYVLDSIEPREDNKYRGKIHGEQLEWFKADLEAKPLMQPAVVVTHIPIFTVTVFNESTYKNSSFEMQNGAICEDTIMLTSLLEKHNVKLALSGHIHMRDNIQMRGVEYINGGAVCGSWWKGPHHGVQEGFGVVDVAADGTMKYEYVDYGWEAVAEG
ncbi:metallophosphoesterase family protein [Lacunimicrobium album]